MKKYDSEPFHLEAYAVFSGYSFSLWQAHSRFQDFYLFADIIKHNVKGKNRLPWERNWEWCLLFIHVTHINFDLQNTAFTCLPLVIPAQLVSLCLNTVFLLLRPWEDSFLPCHSLGPSECPCLCLSTFCITASCQVSLAATHSSERLVRKTICFPLG